MKIRRVSSMLLTLGLISGCAQSQPTGGNEAEQETEQFNVVLDAIDSKDYSKAWDTIFQDTLKAYDNKVEIDSESQGTRIFPADVNGATELESRSTDSDTETVTFTQNGNLYNITATDDDDLVIARYTDAGNRVLELKKGENDTAQIVSELPAPKDSFSTEDRQINLIKSIFNTDPWMYYNPIDNPEYFEFTNNDTGTGTVISIDLLSPEDYTKAVNDLGEAYLDKDGAKVKSVNIKMDYYDVTINANGVLENVTHVIEMDFTTDTETKSERYEIQSDFYSYDYDDFKTQQIDKIFSDYEAGTVKAGDTVELKW